MHEKAEAFITEQLFLTLCAPVYSVDTNLLSETSTYVMRVLRTYNTQYVFRTRSFNSIKRTISNKTKETTNKFEVTS